ncbi:unnamed protein product [Miscanthus lutarioriparius]|uniref:Pentatricopeptide repeat-containing protein n=1 Tax=Miscanthus lutarioriparius TaxID=422564 RepID=A0A811PUF5_9POAL|nr:unnamed protein product [Miscanthus lutarioriparius]
MLCCPELQMLPLRRPASLAARRLLRDNQRISALARAGDVAAARRVFDSMPHRDVVSWNALLTALWRAGRHHLPAARRLFDEAMPSRDVVSWNSIIAGCLAHGDLDAASAYFACAPKRNEATWNAMLAGLLRLGRADDADRLFGEMPKRNVVSYTTMVDGLARRGDVESARRLFDGIRAKDVISWNAMIAGYVHNGHGEEAMRLHAVMFREDVKPDHATLIAVLTACSALALLRQGKSTHAIAIKAMLESGVSFSNALMTMYSKCGNVGESELVFINLRTKDIVSWNTIIAAYAQHGKYQKVIALFHEMEVTGLIPDDITFLSVLSACGHVGMVDASLKLFDLMSSKYAISPRAEHYACIVDILSRAGQLEKASSYIKDMPLEAEKNVWGSLLGACQIHGNVQLGELAAKMLVQSDSESSGPYVILSNIYAAAGMWGQVNQVRGQMKERGVKKQPGYSWTEIANEVHMFVGGDASHPEMRKIISELRKISFHMRMVTNEAHIMIFLANKSEPMLLTVMGKVMLAWQS